MRFQSAEESVWVKTVAGSIEAGKEYNLALTFGEEGFWLYLDGELKDWEYEFTQGLEQNTQNLVIGANGWGRSDQNPDWTRDYFEGTIRDFVIYSTQYDHSEVADLTGLDMSPPKMPGVLYGSNGNDVLSAGDDFSMFAIYGGYGDDVIDGANGNDILDGGHGEDILRGGAGDDLLISRSDGREPQIAQVYGDEDDPYGEIDPNTLTYYSDQPILADDVLVGGAGADTFRFEVLINAKPEKILDHVMDNGMIHWHGVAGENANVHDHWVDRLGNEVVWDFNRAEGDRIEVVGHTVDVYDIEHIDTNSDNVLDATVLHIQSNQGNAGAHNKDQLGTITVFGDLVLESDLTVDAQPAYGIVDHIRDLEEAIEPLVGTPVSAGDAPPPMRDVPTVELPDGVVFGMLDEVDFNGERGSHVEVAHASNMQLSSGTVALNFEADTIWGWQALFSKDYTDNRDGGDLSVFLSDGRIKVRLQSADHSEWVSTEPGLVEAGQDHHLAITFGTNGLWLYLDGEMQDWEYDFTQGLEQNTQNLVIGANTWSRSADHPDLARDHFDGRIGDFMIFNQQFDHDEVATLAGNPPDPPLTEPTVIDGVLHGTNGNDGELEAALFGVNQVQGNYGDDSLRGTSGNDILDGGHGEDILRGGAGDDLLISRSDGREPQIAQVYGDEDDPYGEIDPNTLTYYSDQPILADDVLVGGSGADTFRFEVLINAKPEKILDHVMDNGMIHWHGVAGENANVHDHWVDRLGNEVVWDFNRAEGDRIEVVGHTVDVHEIEHIDTNGDNVLDATVLYVQSNQGNAGAHNKDQLGTITVFGDLVLESDLTVDAQPAYGIVDHIRDLDEAIEPLVGTPVSSGDAPPPMRDVPTVELPDGAVFGMLDEVDFTGESGSHVEVAHASNMELSSGTVSLNFEADTIWGWQALFSKDYTDNRDGGDLSVFLSDGRIKVRLQSADHSEWVSTEPGLVEAGQEHHLAITFGTNGLWLYLDGEMQDWEYDFTQGLEQNTQNLVIGANTWSRNADRPDLARDHFDGRIGDFMIFNQQFDHDEVATLAGNPPDPPLTEPTVIDGVLHGTNGNDGELEAALFGVNQIQGNYGDDSLRGTSGNDILDGGHGEDILRGGAGDDLLISRSDGREPQIAQVYGDEDDPYGEIDPNTLTYYSDQPILADDVLVGGAGADTFRFEVLINAKPEKILDHVMDNGMIHWHGVAGENANVHDHWVDRLGNEVVWDFNRAEGDRIEVVGHTVDVYDIEHIDTNSDNVLDATVLHIQSNQGNAGAHNKDQLGTITVFGDLVLESDLDGLTLNRLTALWITSVIWKKRSNHWWALRYPPAMRHRRCVMCLPSNCLTEP